MKQLISGLPNEIAQECLIHVPYDYLSIATLVCKGWKAEIELPEFLKHRKATGYSQTIVVMSQAQVDQNQNSSAINCPATSMPVYKLTIYEPETGYWHHLPPVPGFSNGGLPMFCQLAGIGSNLVVLGGWHPKTLKVSNDVFIYNFLSAKWGRGADMPGVRRSFFGCASDRDRMVYVAGGHDEEKNALRSVMAYDVANDEWLVLPNMARERDECKAIFHYGKLHVFGGYCTDRQGRFEGSLEVFDFATWQWDPVQEDFLVTATCPKTCMAGADGKLYISCNGNVAVQESATWLQAVAELPAELCNVAYVTTWKSKLLVIGSAKFGEPHTAYVLDLKSCKWTMMEVPVEFTGHVQSSCCLEI